MLLTILATIVFSTGCKKDEIITQDSLKPSRALMTTASGGSFIDARTYGAIPNDGKSDKNAIIKAMYVAKTKQIAEVRLQPGTYDIDAPLVMQSGVTLNGVDKAITTLLGAASVDGFTFISFRNVHNSGLKNLYIDGNAKVRQSTKGNMAINISDGSSNNKLEHLTVTNFGSPKVSGTFISLVTTEDDPSNLANNIISYVDIYDLNNYCSFGIRLHSNWDVQKKSEDYKRRIDNTVIEYCNIKGFTWNSIEMAGPGTIRTKISNCKVFDSKVNSGFDIDKGSSYNEISNCIVENIGMNGGQSTYAYRTQGLNRSTYPRLCIGNKFVNNKAINIWNTGSSAQSGGMLIKYSNDTEVIGNTFSNIEYGSSYNVAAIFICTVKDLVIKNNSIEKASFGIKVIGGTNNYRVNIIENTFSNVTTAYSSLRAGVKSYFTFLYNVFQESTIKVFTTDETYSKFIY